MQAVRAVVRTPVGKVIRAVALPEECPNAFRRSEHRPRKIAMRPELLEELHEGLVDASKGAALEGLGRPSLRQVPGKSEPIGHRPLQVPVGTLPSPAHSHNATDVEARAAGA